MCFPPDFDPNQPPAANAAPFARRLYDSGVPVSPNVEYRPNAADDDQWFGRITQGWIDQRPDGTRDKPALPEDFHDPNDPLGREWYRQRR